MWMNNVQYMKLVTWVKSMISFFSKPLQTIFDLSCKVDIVNTNQLAWSIFIRLARKSTLRLSKEISWSIACLTSSPPVGKAHFIAALNFSFTLRSNSWSSLVQPAGMNTWWILWLLSFFRKESQQWARKMSRIASAQWSSANLSSCLVYMRNIRS